MADIIEIYSASCLKSIGDLSACYLINGDFSNAKKIRELILGNNTNGYNNTNAMTLGLGSNELLNKLDIQNMSGLSSSLDLSGLKNLKELYAIGSSVSGIIFADGGNIEIAEIPSVGSLSMKNLNYLTDDGMKIESYNSLTKLVAENSLLDLISVVNNSPNLYQVRLTGINWILDSTELLERLYSLAGVTNTGANSDQSILSGIVSVPTIGQYELYKYQEAWSDLTIIPRDGVIPQFKVSFKNYDGTELDVQYINQYENAVDPITREENPIVTPIRESSVQYSYEFSGWDKSFTNVVTDVDVYATYEESLRDYTIQYVSMGVPVQTTVGKYGDNILYNGEIPTYTAAEPTAFYLFNRWDKSGFLVDDFDKNGVKTVNAVFDKFTGNSTYFNGKELSDLSPVEIYALTKLGLDNVSHNINVADSYSFTMGYDVDYDDIESNVIISEKTSFNGNNYLDTGITLFDEDKDFVLALDYTMSSGNTSFGTFMQCFQSSGSNGFKLGYDGSGSEFVWGSSTPISPSLLDNREMLVIRHKKGDNNLYVYMSNLSSTSISRNTIVKSSSTHSDSATLIFGASKMDSGRITNYCIGDVHWCKIWYKDLGEKACEQLAGWTHEEITLGVSGFYRYPLYDDSSKETTISLISSHLLDRTMKYNSTNTNAGGWAKSQLNRILNTRFYNAVPSQIKSLLKKMNVLSTIGQKSSAVSESGCYINIPSVYDVDSSRTAYKNELYGGASTITSMSTQQNRRREFRYGFNNSSIDAYESYWLRSPEFTESYSTNYYVWCVNEANKGALSSVNTPTSNRGVVIEISF